MHVIGEAVRCLFAVSGEDKRGEGGEVDDDDEDDDERGEEGGGKGGEGKVVCSKALGHGRLK